jgi:acetate kinase
MEKTRHILTLNSGSSSVKFALFAIGQDQTCLFQGSLEGIGSSDASFQVQGVKGDQPHDWPVSLPDHRAALRVLFAWLEEAHPRGLDAVGHRIVHGGADFLQPHRITPDLLARLEGLISLAPDHLPHEIKAIRAVSQDFPHVPQVACFDTAFHRTLPRKAHLFALPRELESQGVRRYGFHGLSCEYILQELEKEAGTQAAQGRVIIAHLGGGASMTAVYHGQSMETTMGLTPLGGLVMGTRCGDLDPGVLLYLMRTHHLSVDALDNLLNRQSGLLGVSGIDSDMKELLRQEKQDPHAAEAIELFCYQAKKFLGALSAALGGLDTLVFTGGIGENAQVIRERICQDMEFLGIRLDASANQANTAVISAADSPVVVRVIKTDEERMIARHCAALITQNSGRTQ